MRDERDNDVKRGQIIVLFLFAGLHLLIGVGVVIMSVWTADLPGVLLGLVMVSGTLAVAALFKTVLRIGGQVSVVAESLDDFRKALADLQRSHATSTTNPKTAPESARVRTLDLAALGNGDPSRLIAAILDRDAFPRLVKTMDDQPPAQSGAGSRAASSASEATLDAAEELFSRGYEHEAGYDQDFPTPGPAAKNLWRQWKVALRDEDLAGCRAVFAALVDTIGADQLAPLHAQLVTLVRRSEERLRAAFSLRVGKRDFAGALAIGERICRLLPNRPVAEDFRRIRPYLIRRIEAEAEAVKRLRSRAR